MFSSNFFATLASLHNDHSHDSMTYQLLNELIKSSVNTSGFANSDPDEVNFGEYGTLVFPFHSFGNINSLALFGLDELFLFSFYYHNRDRYKYVLDIGGNIGLHSILMSKLGWKVSTYEPDPIHCQILRTNLKLNRCNNINLIQKAVFDENKLLSFVRVEGNTTGSHIQGVKDKPYGKISEFSVESTDINEILDNIDFIKLDAEGAEGKIITRILQGSFERLDIMAEISTKANAELVFDFVKSKKINIFSQKNNWLNAVSLVDMPTSHREGSVFISCKDYVPFV